LRRSPGPRCFPGGKGGRKELCVGEEKRPLTFFWRKTPREGSNNREEKKKEGNSAIEKPDVTKIERLKKKRKRT